MRGSVEGVLLDKLDASRKMVCCSVCGNFYNSLLQMYLSCNHGKKNTLDNYVEVDLNEILADLLQNIDVLRETEDAELLLFQGVDLGNFDVFFVV